MTFTQKLTKAWHAAWASSLTDLFYYLLFAAVVWLLFSIIFRKAMKNRRISRQDATTAQVLREIAYSMRSIGIFGIVTALVVLAVTSGWTRLYLNLDRHGSWWFFASLAIMIVMHDTYFYWTHRLMHHRRLYKFFHHAHHLLHNPTPWAAYAFSPWEAFVQAGIGPLIVFTLPAHPLAFGIFMLWQISFNVLGHCGYEIFPRWLLRSPLGCVLNSITHHAQHHEKFQANYGLYFNVWDRLMGTNHRDYERRFAEVTGGSVEIVEPVDRVSVSSAT